MDITFVHNNPILVDIIKNFKIKGNPCFNFIDEGSKKGKKEAYAIKSDWGARETPFAIVQEKDKVIKAFYSEAEDVLSSLIKFLNGYESERN